MPHLVFLAVVEYIARWRALGLDISFIELVDKVQHQPQVGIISADSEDSQTLHISLWLDYNMVESRRSKSFAPT